MSVNTNCRSGYSDVNGLKMYYEIRGEGNPLLLIHGGGSTIETTFGLIAPLLAKNRQVIAAEMQAHGHTNDRGTDLSFKQDADDIAVLLKNLNIPKADFLGFSNGGQTLIEICLRHPHLLNKIIIASAFYKKSAVVPQFWEGFNHATIDVMPPALKEGYFKANNSQEGFETMFKRDVQRMKTFEDWTDDQIKLITAPALIINATHDVGSVEHAVEMYRMLPNADLAIFPGGHGTYLGAVESLTDGKWPAFNATALIEEFLDR